MYLQEWTYLLEECKHSRRHYVLNILISNPAFLFRKRILKFSFLRPIPEEENGEQYEKSFQKYNRKINT